VTGGWTAWLKALWSTAWRRQTIGSIVMSTLVHASLLAACALWMFSARSRPQPLAIRTEWSDQANPDLTPVEPLPIVVETDTDQAGGSSTGLAVFRHAEGDAGDGVMVDHASLLALETIGQLASLTVPTQTVGLTSGQGQGMAAGMGRGEGDGDGEGDGNGGTFFGLTAEGRRVVYVVDASRSMNHPHPGPMKTRFGRVKLELVKSIGAMAPEQEFFIVYFNDQAWPMPATSMKLAVPSARQRYLRWAVEAKASGTTDPEQALLIALRLNPDVIYFLTDGAFHPTVVDHVRAANNRERVTIHTIGFGDDGGEVLLKEIAFQNWGTYQFIPGDESDPES